MSWQNDKAWSDRFIPQIKRILGQHLIATADWRQDTRENSDLLVFECTPFRVACRIRRHAFLQTNPYEFTIRASRPSENKTELAKIMEGWGNFFFYGFSNKAETEVVNWFIGDLNIFRGAVVRDIYRDKELFDRRKILNRDGSSSFYAWRRDEFPPEFIKAKSTERIPVDEPQLQIFGGATA